MLYLTGVTNRFDEANLIERGIGLVVQPGNGYHLSAPRYPYHAADNGCFADRWSEDIWLKWLATRVPLENCLFATAPDVYPDALATLERSQQFFDLIRDLGFPAALVAQDGAEQLDIPWDDFDCLFIGGERTPNPKNEWKLGEAAERLAGEARNRGKWVHMGRVNSLSRLIRAREMGCLSADGTFLKYRRRGHAGTAIDLDNEGAIGTWVTWLAENPSEKIHESPSLPLHRRAA